jgi:hypothetical protein
VFRVAIDILRGPPKGIIFAMRAQCMAFGLGEILSPLCHHPCSMPRNVLQSRSTSRTSQQAVHAVSSWLWLMKVYFWIFERFI